MNAPRRPSGVWYVIAFAILAVGVLLAGVGFVRDITYAASDAMTRFIAPGTQELSLSKAGNYTIYYEYVSVLNGEMFDTGQSTDIKCAVTSGSGAVIQIMPAPMKTTYQLGSREGKAVAGFTIASPGSYAIKCGYPQANGKRVVLGVGRNFVGGLAVGIFRDVTVLIVSFVACGLIIIITAMRRAG